LGKRKPLREAFFISLLLFNIFQLKLIIENKKIIMKRPEIEQNIVNKGNKLATVTAFLGIGVGSFAVNKLGWGGLPALIAVLPVALDTFGLKKLIGDGNGFKGGMAFAEPLFKRSMKKWITNYIDDSENLTEKKYKAICLKLWMSHKRVNSEILVGYSNEVFDNLSRELFHKKETKHHLEILFDQHVALFAKDPAQIVTEQSFIDEDLNKPEKIEIAKKVYDEYAHIGIAGKAVVTRFDPKIYLFLQDYKLNPMDYKWIKEYTEELKKNDEFNPLSQALYEDGKKELMEKVIAAEDNVENLKILGKYYTQLIKSKNHESKDLYSYMNKQINTKISYIELGGELESKEEAPKKTTRKMKI
jgi:hypothetical protein